MSAYPHSRRLFVCLLLAASFARTAQAEVSSANVFVEGQAVTVPVPAAWTGWRAVDVGGKEVAAGTGSGTAELGRLPIGYFELRQTGGTGRVTAAVVAKIEPIEDTPIALDTGMSWFYADPAQLRDACRLARLAGVKWIRERSVWGELETARGVWADETRYERAMRIEHEEGLKVLEVNHVSAPWATSDPRRFPEDLRDVFNFYRGLAARWKGLADAIEPWNEPDIDLFGGHTGCEIASYHKAAALGLRAGNPAARVSGTVFALDRVETLDEFGPNDVHPYFDVYHLHHYVGLDAYPRAYGRHRAVSGGRPMWTTEFNLPVPYTDQQTKEPTDFDMRVAGFRVGKMYAAALHEGMAKGFYFILGDYVERGLQFGLVHADLTPRPAYVAFAAVGRLLNGARPSGRVDLGDEKLKGFVFETVVDGKERETLVAWSETDQTRVEVPGAEASYDYLGRPRKNARRARLSRRTVYFVLPRGGSKELKITSPPAKPVWREGKTCPVVLQLVGKADSAKSAFVLEKSRTLRLAIYNFGDQPAIGELKIQGASGTEGTQEIPPGARDVRTITADGPGQVMVSLELGELGRAVVSASVTSDAGDP